MKNKEKNEATSSKDTSLAVNLRSQLKSRMEAMDINIRALERKAGLNTGAVNNILNGASANPTAETLNALANAFGCTIDELLNRDRKADRSSNSSTYLAEFKSFAWNANLLFSIITELNKQVTKRQVNISAEKALYIIEKLYLYSLKRDKDIADESLIDWLLDQP